MTFYYSKPFENLLVGKKPGENVLANVSVLIIGSGYGGSVAAYRLAGTPDDRKRGHRVMVLERGREYALGEFPMTIDEMPGYVRAVRNGQARDDAAEDSLFDIRLGEGVDVLVGSGLGGTSLINANVALRPTVELFQQKQWPKAIRAEATNLNSSLWNAFDKVGGWLTNTARGEEKYLSERRKYQAFSKYAKSLKFIAQSAHVAVTLGTAGATKTNAAGIKQKVCTHCGNCVTGCNVGAKNTLAMNFIPAAFQNGVELFTGAHVLRVERNLSPGGRRWKVQVQASTRETRVRYDDDYFIETDTVVLAAGTLGSTEILQRSTPALPLPKTLGQRFSTNGDALAVSFGENDPVHAVGQLDQNNPDIRCGPTITAVAHGRTDNGDAFTIEDGAFPSGLLAVLGEVITTSAQLGRLGRNDLPGWFSKSAGKKPDPLSVHSEALENSQLFLIMADDGAKGHLRFSADAVGADPDDVRVMPVWPATDQAASGSVLNRIDDVLARQDRDVGMNYGQYVRNPLWQLLPASAGGAMSGRFPGGRLLSVHPLGGCPMADSGDHGVVNHLGQVFQGAGTDLHSGIYVLDGAIIPGALGINPLLTIAALAWRSCDVITSDLQIGEPDGCFASKDPPTVQVLPSDPGLTHSSIIVSEQLVGQLDKADDAARKALVEFTGDTKSVDQWVQSNALVLRLQTIPFELPDLATATGEIAINLQLHQNPVCGDLARNAHIYGVPSAHLGHETLIADGTGTMTFMTPQFPDGLWQTARRAVEAFRAYFVRRQSFVTLLRDQLNKHRSPERSMWDFLRALFGTLYSMCNVAAMHGTYREFRYSLEFKGKPGSPTLLMEGTKRIAWRRDNPRLWESLLRLPISLSFANRSGSASAEFAVDMGFLFGEGLVKVGPDVSVPRGILSCFSFGMRMARCAMQAGFWEFGAPEYPEDSLLKHPNLPPTLKSGAVCESISFPVQSQRQKNSPAGTNTPSLLQLSVHRYPAKAGCRSQPVLLIHGLAQGSLIYAHQKMSMSMADYLVQQGYDVWLLDYRLSNQFDERQIPYENWSIDEIGKFDVPEAVKTILLKYDSGTRIHIFAHCVGAIATTMAILNGDLTKQNIASVVLNAIHPWTIPSGANKVRAKLGVFIRDWLTDALFDPIVQNIGKVDATQSILDRVAFSLARLGEQADGRHDLGDDASLSNAICDRMTFLYGRMWKHDNVTALHPHWKDLVGRAPGTVQRHLYYMLIHGRVVTHEGINEYLSEENLQNWLGIRTLFIHGEESQVFNPESAKRSAVRMSIVLNDKPENEPARSERDPTPVRLRRIPGYGHMDVILADTAHIQTYPYLHAFFEGHFDKSDQYGQLKLDPIDKDTDIHGKAKAAPIAGPILRAARIEGDQIIRRIWVELPSDNTSPVEGLDLTGIPVEDVTIVEKNRAQTKYYWADVTTPSDDYRPLAALARVGGMVLSNFLGEQFHGQASNASRTQSQLPGNSEAVRALAPVKLPSWLSRLRSGAQDCHFIVGSCLYPGTPFDQSYFDQVFDGMFNLLEKGIECDLLFLIGDQIYADATAGILDPKPWRDRYVDRYRTAFHSPAVSAVLSIIPCHFAIDDHEFADNYAGYIGTVTNTEIRDMKTGAIGKDQFEFARETAQMYMDSGRSDSAFGASDTRPVAEVHRTYPGTFWYPLDHTTEIHCPAFILDTRSERERATTTQDARLMGDEQMNAFLLWLSQNAKDPKPKFVFLGSPIIPLTRDFQATGGWARQDGPTGYPKQLERIIGKIVDEEIERVVFVGGDPHLSCWAKMQIKRRSMDLEALHIVSSGLYSPLPFANMSPTDVDWNEQSAITLSTVRIEYTPQLLIAGPPHFLRVSAIPAIEQRWTIAMEVYDKAACLVKRDEHTF